MATNAYFLNQYKLTTLSVAGGIDDSQTADIVIQDITDVETAKPGIIAITYADPIDTTKVEYISYTSIGAVTKELAGVTRGAEGSSAKTHDNGAVVAFSIISESHINNLATAVTIGGDETNALEGILDEDDMVTDSATKGATQQSIKAYVDNNASSSNHNLYENALINGNFDIWQRGTSFVAGANNDDVYLADRFILLSDGNDIVDVTQSTDVPNGSKYSMKLQVETANKKFGILQIIENKDAMKLDNQTFTVSFKAKTTTAKVIENLRVAVISWDSTADTVTSDIVSAWEAEGTVPTLVANWTYENTATDKAITTSWATYSVTGITIDTTSMANVGIFIWVDDGDAAVDDELFISQVKLELGSTATTFQPKSYAEELMACQRYYYRMDAGSPYQTFANGSADSTTRASHQVNFPIEMRAVPTLSSSTASSFWNNDGANTIALSALSIDTSNDGKFGCQLNAAVVSGLTQFRPYYLRANNDTTLFIAFDAEL